MAHRRKLTQEIYRLLYGSGLCVDVIVETPEKFLELKDNPYLIYQQIETKGCILYDKQRSSTRIYSRSRDGRDLVCNLYRRPKR